MASANDALAACGILSPPRDRTPQFCLNIRGGESRARPRGLQLTRRALITLWNSSTHALGSICATVDVSGRSVRGRPAAPESTRFAPFILLFSFAPAPTTTSTPPSSCFITCCYAPSFICTHATTIPHSLQHPYHVFSALAFVFITAFTLYIRLSPSSPLAAPLLPHPSYLLRQIMSLMLVRNCTMR